HPNQSGESADRLDALEKNSTRLPFVRVVDYSERPGREVEQTAGSHRLQSWHSLPADVPNCRSPVPLALMPLRPAVAIDPSLAVAQLALSCGSIAPFRPPCFAD